MIELQASPIWIKIWNGKFWDQAPQGLFLDVRLWKSARIRTRCLPDDLKLLTAVREEVRQDPNLYRLYIRARKRDPTLIT